MKHLYLLVFLVGADLSAQTLERGDVLISTSLGPVMSRVLVYSRDGAFKRELASSDNFIFRETLVHQGRVYVPTQFGVRTFDLDGTGQADFGRRSGLVYLSPAADGSVVASDGSGELFHFNRDGSERWYRDTVIRNEPRAHGLDLAPDQCSVFSETSESVAVWDLCQDIPPRQVSPLRGFPTGTALRMLADGGFLVAYRTNTERLDSAGNTVRRYDIPGRALALDIDGLSFWVGAGGSLLRVDIATGAIQKNVYIGEAVLFLSVVGEPRAALAGAAIPTLEPLFIVLLTVGLAVVAFARMR